MPNYQNQVTREDLEILIRSIAPLSEVGAKNLLRLMFLTMRHYLEQGCAISCRPLGVLYPEETKSVIKLCRSRATVNITPPLEEDQREVFDGLEDLIELEDSIADQSKVKGSLISYFREDFPKKKGWLHPNTGLAYRYEAMRDALNNLKNHETEYQIVRSKWLEEESFDRLSSRLYLSASSCRRKEARAVWLIILWVVIPSLPVEISKEIS